MIHVLVAGVYSANEPDVSVYSFRNDAGVLGIAEGTGDLVVSRIRRWIILERQEIGGAPPLLNTVIDLAVNGVPAISDCRGWSSQNYRSALKLEVQVLVDGSYSSVA